MIEKKQHKFEPIAAKPISIARHDCLSSICDVLNCSNLPAFAKVEILERILNELRPMVDIEYQHDLELYEKAKGGVIHDD